MTTLVPFPVSDLISLLHLDHYKDKLLPLLDPDLASDITNENIYEEFPGIDTLHKARIRKLRSLLICLPGTISTQYTKDMAVFVPLSTNLSAGDEVYGELKLQSEAGNCPSLTMNPSRTDAIMDIVGSVELVHRLNGKFAGNSVCRKLLGTPGLGKSRLFLSLAVVLQSRIPNVIAVYCDYSKKIYSPALLLSCALAARKYPVTIKMFTDLHEVVSFMEKHSLTGVLFIDEFENLYQQDYTKSEENFSQHSMIVSSQSRRLITYYTGSSVWLPVLLGYKNPGGDDGSDFKSLSDRYPSVGKAPNLNGTKVSNLRLCPFMKVDELFQFITDVTIELQFFPNSPVGTEEKHLIKASNNTSVGAAVVPADSATITSTGFGVIAANYLSIPTQFREQIGHVFYLSGGNPRLVYDMFRQRMPDISYNPNFTRVGVKEIYDLILKVNEFPECESNDPSIFEKFIKNFDFFKLKPISYSQALLLVHKERILDDLIDHNMIIRLETMIYPAEPIKLIAYRMETSTSTGAYWYDQWRKVKILLDLNTIKQIIAVFN